MSSKPGIVLSVKLRRSGHTPVSITPTITSSPSNESAEFEAEVVVTEVGLGRMVLELDLVFGTGKEL